jgi:formate dehydrogenase major subunit
MYAGSLADADCIIVQGSNMAENHPVAFRWVMQAKLKGAKVIHVDPRFTRTSAVADLYAPIRAGADIAFLGGIINHVINSTRWNTDPFFRDYVINYTNAATIVSDDFKDTEDMDGVFSGLQASTEAQRVTTAQENLYANASWQYKRQPAGADGRGGQTGGQEGPPPGQAMQPGQPSPAAASSGPPFDDLVRSLLPPTPVERDTTLQNPRCVFQIMKRHYSRYTPEMVERVTGCPRDTFLKVAETLLANSGAERTSSFCYAVAWTQHTYGVQMIGAAALLQLLLGNMGRPGGGIMALRGHATIQGSTDIPTLYHSIHGYMAAPSALRPHDNLVDYLKAETVPTAFWANQPKYMVSYLKSMYGDAATAQNQFGYDWHPKINGDHSHMAMIAAMSQGQVKGMFVMGQNPATSLNARLARKAFAKLDWMVVRDAFETETSAFWYASPEVKNDELKIEDIKTEVFLLPSAQVGEMEGSFTNTQRLVQFHEKAVDPPGDARSDSWFTHQLALRLKKLYTPSSNSRDEGFNRLTWDFDYDTGKEPKNTRIHGEPDTFKIWKEINGFNTETKGLLAGFGELRDDGSTTCASWIYCGIYPKEQQLQAANRTPDPNNLPGSNLSWGWSWPANRRIMYNRASARPDGSPWSERKKWVWWDNAQRRWVGNDVPDFALTKAPDTPAREGGIALDAQSGTDPFIMKADGKGWLYTPSGMVDGPLPTHYEAVESPVKNPLYRQQSSPVYKHWKVAGNDLAPPGDTKFPYVITTYRLTEHHLSGVMSRWLPWLAELQPELFIEISPELAAEKGIENLGWVKISTPRGEIQAKALVTRRMRPLNVDGRTVHQVGMPWHWGYMGISTGAVVNDLTSLIADPNVSMHEGKSFVCNIEKGSEV